MKTIKQKLLLIGLTMLMLSCSKNKEVIEPGKKNEDWKFTGIVNIHATKSAQGLDFYQHKGDKIRILQFEFDDYVTLFFLDSVVLNANDMRFPISSVEGYLSADNQFFDKKGNKVFTPGNTKWPKGDAPHFSSFNNFESVFGGMVAADRNAANFNACIYSFEKPNAGLTTQKTYTFFDFKNNKSIYYVPANPILVKKTNTIAELFPNGTGLDWTKIDAACTDAEIGKTYGSNLYFFDFDAQKFYVCARSNQVTGNPKMESLEPAMDFSKQFHVAYNSEDNTQPFDFKK